MKNVRSIITICAMAIGLSAYLASTGCESTQTSNTLSENSGSTLTTTEGQQITDDMLLGKWDLDGELTNTANGNSGVEAIPSDIVKDVLGKGWRFERGGVLRTDAVVGSKAGTWKIDGKNTLTVQEAGQVDPHSYQVSFRGGYMYLKRGDGRYMVMERDKFSDQ